MQDISSLMRPAWFVTENMKIQILLNQFKSKKSQIAVVVDEYGGTSGIITLEDIMEELVGEIQDEYDIDETPSIEKIDDNTVLVNGMCGIREINNEFRLELDPEKYDNIADFLLEFFNHVPKIGEKFLFQDRVEFMIEDSNKTRINKVRIERINSNDQYSQ
jgi:CBS domain containing-hemolysin-like protein